MNHTNRLILFGVLALMAAGEAPAVLAAEITGTLSNDPQFSHVSNTASNPAALQGALTGFDNDLAIKSGLVGFLILEVLALIALYGRRARANRQLTPPWKQ